MVVREYLLNATPAHLERTASEHKYGVLALLVTYITCAVVA